MKKQMITTALITALIMAAGLVLNADSVLPEPAPAAMTDAAGKDGKTQLLHLTGEGTLYIIRADGTVMGGWTVRYGHLIEVSNNALGAHLSHGDVPATAATAVNGGKYVRTADIPRLSSPSASVWISF